MNKTTLNTLTTFIPLILVPLIGMLLIFNTFCNTKRIGIIILLSVFPIQGLVIIFRKNVYFKYWLSEKEKIIDGLLWIAVGILIILLCLKKGFFNM